MQHPIDLLYAHLTHILAPALGESVATVAACSCCKRPASSFGNVGYQGLDSYKTPFNHCAPCQAMFVTDPNIMGNERTAGKSDKKVGQRFGMMSGVGWVHEIADASGVPHRSTLLAPPGVYDKFPASFFECIDVVKITVGGHLPWIAKNAKFPLLYIESFGRKTAALMRGLTISLSPHALYCCSDAGMDSVTRVECTIDLVAAMQLSEGLSSLTSPERNAFNKLVVDISNGRISPKQASEQINKKPAFGPIFRTLPADPHQRIKLINIADKLQ
ncbi:hypothetical protein ACET98_11260 [Aeromonas veronii]|uniref:hypothetical protein n=1 Tax=Aeromonas sp. R7-5 TaxID=3138477 RepID=UPI0034A53A96